MSMPFCRECGKQVEDGWVTCPYCSQPIGPPNSTMSVIQDSVIMGNYNDPNTFTDAIQNAHQCGECGTIGSIQYTCEDCNKLIVCDEHACKNTFNEKKILELKHQGIISCFSRYLLAFDDYEKKCINCCVPALAKVKESNKRSDRKRYNKLHTCDYCNKLTRCSDFEVNFYSQTLEERVSRGPKNTQLSKQVPVVKMLQLQICEFGCPEFYEQRNTIPQSLLDYWKDSEYEYIQINHIPKDKFQPLRDLVNNPVYEPKRYNKYDNKREVHKALRYFEEKTPRGAAFSAWLLTKQNKIVDMILPYGPMLNISEKVEFRNGYGNINHLHKITYIDYINNPESYSLVDFAKIWYRSSLRQIGVRNRMINLYEEINDVSNVMRLEILHAGRGDGNNLDDVSGIELFLQQYDPNYISSE